MTTGNQACVSNNDQGITSAYCTYHSLALASISLAKDVFPDVNSYACASNGIGTPICSLTSLFGVVVGECPTLLPGCVVQQGGGARPGLYHASVHQNHRLALQYSPVTVSSTVPL